MSKTKDVLLRRWLKHKHQAHDVRLSDNRNLEDVLIHDKGSFATGIALAAAYPTASAGDYAVVYATDTFWLWDTATVAWLDSGISSMGAAPTPVVRTNNPITAITAANTNIDALDAAIGADNVAVGRTNNPTVVNTTVLAKVQALDNAVGADNVAVARTNNPTVVNTTVLAKIQAVDNAIGGDLVPIVRTNNPVVSNTTAVAKISALDTAIGVDNTAVARTNNPTVVNTSLNIKIQALDNAIGADLVPVVRTNNPLVSDTTVVAKLSVLDNAIGTTPTSLYRIAAANTVNANITLLDAALGPITTGTAGAATVTLREYVSAYHHVTSLTLTNFIVGAIPGAGALAIGALVYTFPAGVHVHKVTYSNVGLTAPGHATDPQTPVWGIGSVVGAGAVAVLNGTAGFMDYITEQTAADINNTPDPTLLPATGGVMGGISLSMAGGVKTVYFNAAETWAAANTGDLLANGTIILEWTVMP